MKNLLFLMLAAMLLAPFASASAAMAPTFGPKQYTRTAGPPQTFTDSFPRCGGSPCQLVIRNGAPDGSHRISSASIYVNGKQIFGPSAFDQQVGTLTMPIALQDSDQLKVVLNSAPGSYLTISVECANFAAPAIANDTSVLSTIWDDGTVSLSIPLANDGNVSATDVSITGMSAGGGRYVGPTPFAYAAGGIDPGGVEQLYGQFTNLDGQAPFPLTVTGTYGFGGVVCSFQAQTTVNPPPPGNGGVPKSSTTVQRFTADTAFYPPTPPPPGPDAQTNDAENNYMPPLGRPRYLFTTPPASSVLDQALAFAPDDQAPAGAGSSVSFVRNQNGGNYWNYPPDPSAAGADPSGFVLISANNRAGTADGAVSYSKDFGKSFTTVNLTQASGFTDPSNKSRTDFFPQSDGGLCCDQVLHYVPGRNLMIWLLQYWSPAVNVGGLPQKGQNRLRIAWATPQAAAADFLHAWSWFDITPTTLGDTTATDWMDYPDLAYSNGWLYISVDHGYWNPNTNPSTGNVIGQQVNSDRRWMVRASLDDMAGNRSSINLVYYEPIKNGLVKSHFVQSAPDTMYYAALPDTSTISVFADPDSSPNIPAPKDIAVTLNCQNISVNPCNYNAPAPDLFNWDVAPHGMLGGAYVAPSVFCPPSGCGPTRFLYFAYDGGSDTSVGRPWPYVRVEKIDADALTLVSEVDIWNPGFAFATPALQWRAGSGKDEVAFSLAIGGGGKYADNAVGFLGDFVAYVTTSSNATQTDSSGNVRYGDYFSVRNATGPMTPYGQGVGYATLGYGVTRVDSAKTCAVGGCNVGLQYILFGRSEDLFPTPPNPGPK